MSASATIPRKAPDLGSASGNLSLWVARNVAEVEALREMWESWEEHPNSVIDNYLAYFQVDPASRPHVMVVFRGGHPECLLIGKRLPRAATSVLTKLLPPADLLYFIEGGLLGNASIENCELLVRAILAQLSRGEADVAEFFLRVDSPLYRASIQLPNFFCRDHFPNRVVHRYLALPESFQDFLAGLPAKERRNLRYRENRLMKKFPEKVWLRRFRGPEDVECLIEDAEEVAKKAYQRAVGRGFTLADGPGLRAEARKGSLRGYVLYMEATPCAYLISSWRKGVLYGTFVGHDPKYAEHSPGRYLLMRCIEDCFLPSGGKTVVLDPGAGDQPYKRLFTNRAWQCAYLRIHPPTFQGLVRNLATTTLAFAAHCGRGLVATANLFPLMQKIHRNKAMHKGDREETVS